MIHTQGKKQIETDSVLLNNQEITEEIRGNLKIPGKNDNENTMTPNLWNAVKAVLRGKFISIQSYFKKQEKSQININLTPKATTERKTNKRNPKVSWRKVKVAQLCPTLCDPMDYTVCGIL